MGNNVKVKVLFKDNCKPVPPSYSTFGAAGADIRACITAPVVIKPGERALIPTGLLFEIPEGYVGLIFPRSSNSKKDLLLCNSVGVIDSGYRGEIKLRYKKIVNPSEEKTNILQNIFTNSSTLIYEIERYEVGDKVGQIMIIPIPFVEFTEVSELSQTDRGDGGFGSTGK